MGNEVGLLDRQRATEVSEIVELAIVREGRILAPDVESKRRLSLEHSEKHRILWRQHRIDFRVWQQRHAGRIAVNEALVMPDGRKARVRTSYRACQLVRILSPVTGAVHEGTGKNIEVLHVLQSVPKSPAGNGTFRQPVPWRSLNKQLGQMCRSSA